LVAAIESRAAVDVGDKVSELLARGSDLLSIPEVALAALSKGYDPDSFGCVEAMQASDWARDPAFMWSLARRREAGWTFGVCCSDDLRNNKAFLLEVLKLDRPPCLHVEGDLEHDYDILCAMFGHRVSRWDRIPTRRDMDFIRKVRGRLQQYLSLEAFMAGIQSEESCRPHQGLAAPVTLLRQDQDTLHDFKRRMVELLGCVSHEEASVLRRVSLTFTMHGF
jgi:hypothetical protein